MNFKNILFFIVLFGILFLPFFSFGQTFQRGSTGESVKELQNLLKTDPAIYPQGLVTGYFGPATEQAIKRLQAKYGLPQTGIVDEATIGVIFPTNVQIKVLAPNGGESWDKSSNHSIQWQVSIGPLFAAGRELAPGASSSPNEIASPSIVPFLNKVSIDLIRDSEPSYRYRIATADLFQTQYSWKIPNGVSNASDYKIRISGGQAPCLNTGNPNSTQPPCTMLGNSPYFQYLFSDTSDNVFSITGSSVPGDTALKLKALIEQMQQILNTLLSQLQYMRELMGGL